MDDCDRSKFGTYDDLRLFTKQTFRVEITNYEIFNYYTQELLFGRELQTKHLRQHIEMFYQIIF